MNLPATWIWTVPQDYTKPGANATKDCDDLHLPIGEVYVKATDGTAQFYDAAGYKRMVATYRDQGISLAWWTVPHGVDVPGEVTALLPALAACPRLIIDFERAAEFWSGPLSNIKAYLAKLQLMQPRPWLALCYDPRQVDLRLENDVWRPYIDAYMPMCYWVDFTGQGKWGDPAGCIDAAWAGRLNQMPMIFALQGAEPDPSRFAAAVDRALELGGVSVWRRGETTVDNWRVLGARVARKLEKESFERGCRLWDGSVAIDKGLKLLRGEKA
jgi:hypothetical protein